MRNNNNNLKLFASIFIFICLSLLSVYSNKVALPIFEVVGTKTILTFLCLSSSLISLIHTFLSLISTPLCPPAALGAVFGITTCLSAQARDAPEDPFNYFIGGCASGALLGAKSEYSHEKANKILCKKTLLCNQCSEQLFFYMEGKIRGG